MDDSSDEEEKNVKHDPDKVIKTEDGDIKQDPDQPAKLETGQTVVAGDDVVVAVVREQHVVNWLGGVDETAV